MTRCQELVSATRYPNLSFRLLITDTVRRAIACAEAIRSVTHLVLALWQVRAIHPHLNRKGGRKGHTPPARFVGTVRLPRLPDLVKCHVCLFIWSSLRCLLCLCCFHLPVRPTRFGESRKRSVPLRVHSVFKSFGFTGRLLPGLQCPTRF